MHRSIGLRNGRYTNIRHAIKKMVFDDEMTRYENHGYNENKTCSNARNPSLHLRSSRQSGMNVAPIPLIKHT